MKKTKYPILTLSVLIHKYQDTEARQVNNFIKLYAGDEVFQKRAKTLKEIFNLSIKLRGT